MSLASSLEFTTYLSKERNPVPWGIGIGHIYSIRDLFYETNLKKCFNVSSFVLSLFRLSTLLPDQSVTRYLDLRSFE